MNSILKDVNASFVVFLVALPLCLGVALASDAPLMSGLISGIIGGLVVACLGGSQVAVSGPAAGLTIVVAQSIRELGSFELFANALFFAGFIQIFLSMTGFEKLSQFIPSSVVRGLLSAIGLLICYKELPFIFGLTSQQFYSADVINGVRPENLLISIVAALSLLLWGRAQRKWTLMTLFPPQVICIFMAGLTAHFASQYVPMSFRKDDFVQLPHFKAAFQVFMPETTEILKTMRIAVTVALIASIETLLCLEASLSLDPLHRPLQRRKELVAQGVGNSLSGLFGGIPLTAVIVRTAANIEAGALTKWSSFLHGLWLLIFVMFLSPLAQKIPLSALAVVLIYVGFKLFSPSLIRRKWSLGFINFSTYIVTVMMILVTDILVGVTLGTLYFYILRKIVSPWSQK